jgi:phospholipase C
MSGTASSLGIEHVYVLMLENRAFDHMLGFSGITGADAVTRAPTAIDGLTGGESNFFNGVTYPVIRGADNVMPLDPPHEFPNVLEQLCGPGAAYPAGGAYPPIDNSGFVASYVAGKGKQPGEIMKCYTPGQLPVLNALAAEFVVCDNWHASIPGPTWPNRIFVHAASSGGLDHSPSAAEIVNWEVLDGLALPNGHIFDRLNTAGIRRRLYAGDDFPTVAALKGIHLDDIRHYSSFSIDVQQAGYDDRYIFIEPSYDVLNNYRNGTSQHPLGDVTRGEALIKSTYEAIRNSPAWNSSLLIVTWDEHGGFFDHAIPPAAIAPGDTAPGTGLNQYGFTFEQYGARVAAVIISPLIPKNLVDHRLYDHSSIPATVESLFGLAPLTARDAAANHLDALVTLAAPRTDTPPTLPATAAPFLAPMTAETPPPVVAAPDAAASAETVNQGNLPVVVHSALRQDLQLSPPEARAAILARVAAMQTKADAQQYLKEVQQKIRAARGQGTAAR